VIVSLTGGDLGRALVSNRWLRTLRRVFIIADALIVDSDYGARLADACGAARTKIRKIADTAHVKIVEPRGPRARPPGPRTGPLRIIAHAPLVERHGIAVAFEAMALCRERGFDIELVVLGSGPLRRALRSYAAHLGLGNRVSFPGNADDEQFIDELHGSDAFLSPVVTAHDGDRETSPTRETLIAMAAAVPIIASRHPSVAELLRDGDNSLLVEERDAEGLAAALQLASTRSMRSLGRKARESIDALPSTESWVAEHLRLYDDIVGGRVNSASRAAHVASAR
jgi:glycosyltransferase involved in cell wall biosynthesis